MSRTRKKKSAQFLDLDIMDVTPVKGRNEWDEGPRTSSDLVMHPRKLSEIRNWLERCSPRGLLLLTGPSGSGKTTAVRVICKEQKIGLSEWIDLEQENEEESFSDFVTSRPPGRNGVLLVRHLPHAMYSDTASFCRALRSIPPSTSVIFCLPATPSSWHLNPCRLFSQMICCDFGIAQIVTNPFANTYLLKAMKERRGKRSDVRDAELTEMAKISEGDLRKALTMLDLRQRFGKVNAYDKADSAISLFHAVGRVVYAKRAERSEREWMEVERLTRREECRRPQPDYNVNKLVEETPIDSQKLLSFVFDHSPRFSPSDTLHSVLEAISLADAHLYVWNRRTAFDQYALQTVVRSSLFHNYRVEGPAATAKYCFSYPLHEQLGKELRKISAENEVKMCFRKEFYTETVPMLSLMDRLPPSMDYFSQPLGTQAWKQGLDRYAGGEWSTQAATRSKKKDVEDEEDEEREYEIVETDVDLDDSF